MNRHAFFAAILGAIVAPMIPKAKPNDIDVATITYNGVEFETLFKSAHDGGVVYFPENEGRFIGGRIISVNFSGWIKVKQ